MTASVKKKHHPIKTYKTFRYERIFFFGQSKTVCKFSAYNCLLTKRQTDTDIYNMQQENGDNL